MIDEQTMPDKKVVEKTVDLPIVDEDTEVIKKFDARLKELLNEYGVEIKILINFPRYNQMPPDIQNETKFALYLLNKHGGTLVPTYKRKGKK